MAPSIEDDVRPRSNPQPRIPEGEYEVVCFKAEVKPYRGREKKLYLHFRIINCEHEGKDLYCAYNFNYRRFPRGSKYYTDWSIANDGLPRRKDKMSYKIFIGKAFTVLVRDAIPKYDGGEPMPEMFHYSVVDRIKEKTAG